MGPTALELILIWLQAPNPWGGEPAMRAPQIVAVGEPLLHQQPDDIRQRCQEVRARLPELVTSLQAYCGQYTNGGQSCSRSQLLKTLRNARRCLTTWKALLKEEWEL